MKAIESSQTLFNHVITPAKIVKTSQSFDGKKLLPRFEHQKQINSCLKNSQYGCFRKQGYPQIIHFNRVFHYKPSILWVPLFLETSIFKTLHLFKRLSALACPESQPSLHKASKDGKARKKPPHWSSKQSMPPCLMEHEAAFGVVEKAEILLLAFLGAGRPCNLLGKRIASS